MAAPEAAIGATAGPRVHGDRAAPGGEAAQVAGLRRQRQGQGLAGGEGSAARPWRRVVFLHQSLQQRGPGRRGRGGQLGAQARANDADLGTVLIPD